MESNYFRRGFGLKSVIAAPLAADYGSAVVESLRASGNRMTVGRYQFRLAQEFGFCYGVDRAVEYAYESRTKFPDKKLFLVGEIIHNPHVNDKLRAMGITFLERGDDGEFDFSGITPDDVVLIPAFGVTRNDFLRLGKIGCIVVDTTCGSVLNVWKRVEGYARDGYTAIIHGKYYHEETKATASQVERHPGGKYLVVYNLDETAMLTDYIEHGGDQEALARHFQNKASPGFDFTCDLERIGVANQTTMLAGETMAVAAAFRRAYEARYGAEHLAEHFRAFDTLCSATQERQDAVHELLKESPDLMIVIGGYNSSNTCALAALAQDAGVRTFHISDSDQVDPERGTITYQPVRTRVTETVANWLPASGVIGITAGASTPNNKIGSTIAEIARTAGLEAELQAALDAANS
jgi:4-hydroxy-3-methylbut-2-enyl diphosphate reductase